MEDRKSKLKEVLKLIKMGNKSAISKNMTLYMKEFMTHDSACTYSKIFDGKLL